MICCALSAETLQLDAGGRTEILFERWLAFFFFPPFSLIHLRRCADDRGGQTLTKLCLLAVIFIGKARNNIYAGGKHLVECNAVP